MYMDWLIIWQAFYFICPAYCANMAPVFARRINFLNYPVDFGQKLLSAPLFGKNKTWRGIVFAVIVAIVIFWLQMLIGVNSFLDYSTFSLASGALFGGLLGLGAMVGDLFGSFIKRRFRIRPGKSFVPLDQIDLALGAILLTLPLYRYTWLQVFWVLLLTFFITQIANYIGYCFKIREVKR